MSCFLFSTAAAHLWQASCITMQRIMPVLQALPGVLCYLKPNRRGSAQRLSVSPHPGYVFVCSTTPASPPPLACLACKLGSLMMGMLLLSPNLVSLTTQAASKSVRHYNVAFPFSQVVPVCPPVPLPRTKKCAMGLSISQSINGLHLTASWSSKEHPSDGTADRLRTANPRQ